jgi:hypothetical protein
MEAQNISFTKNDDLMTRNIAGEALIVPIKGRVGDLSAIYTLNDVGARVWQLIDGRTPVNQIIEAISEEYDVTKEEAAADVTELLDSMKAAGLIHPAVEVGA